MKTSKKLKIVKHKYRKRDIMIKIYNSNNSERGGEITIKEEGFWLKRLSFLGNSKIYREGGRYAE